MEIVMTLDDKVRAYKVLLDKKDELAEQTKANNEELKIWNRKSHSRW